MTSPSPSPSPSSGSTWIESDLTVARKVGRPFRKFLHIEAAGGIALLAATVVALVWANSPFSGSYESFWNAQVTLLSFGDFSLSEPLSHWVNDALMVIFFFVVGLEIKTELVSGELREPRRAAVPVIAALGGMAIPALLFLVFNAGGPGAHGWGIPMATDIAFTVGVLSLFGSRLPSSLKVFLLTLAIADDIGAIAVIAIFYTDDLSLGWLAVAGALLALTGIMRIIRVWYVPLYIVVGAAAWLAMHESGVHATISGVVLGLIAPAVALRPEPTDTMAEPATSVEEVRLFLFNVRETVPITERLQGSVHPFSSFLILPVFALANAGIEISVDGIKDASTSALTVGVVVGLVAGKAVGVTLATWIATRLGVGPLPEGAGWRHVIGVGALAGIGFTVAIFISGLAFSDPALIEEAKLGILVASVIAAILGSVILLRASRESSDDEAEDESADGLDRGASQKSV